MTDILTLPAGPLVDRRGYVWAPAQQGDGWYVAGQFADPDLPPRPPTERVYRAGDLAMRWGPLRPVAPPSPCDAEHLAGAYRWAGRKALASAAAALAVIVADGRTPALAADGPASDDDVGARLLLAVLHRAEPERVDPDAADLTYRTLAGWTRPDGETYTDPAAGVSWVLGQVIDDHERNGGMGPRGFASVADELVVRHPAAHLLRPWVLARSAVHGPR